MLQRPAKPKSAKERRAEKRQRERDGIAFDLVLRTDIKRLTAAFRVYAEGRHPFPEGEPTKAELEAELLVFVEDMVERPIGPPPKKKPHA
jgi:hypothetical protein